MSINPLHLEVWLYMGFAALEIENWNIAATAYRRYTALEPGNFEAWNNLAKAYIKLNNKHSAHRALLDALKCNYENWKVWDNLMVVSSDIAHFADVIRSYHRILDLKGKHMDPEVLETLVYSVNNNINDAEGNPSGKYMQKTRELLGRLISIFGSDGNLWTFYAVLSPVVALRAQRLQRAYNSFTYGQWDKDITTCVQVLHVCHKLAEIVLSDEVEPTDAIVNSVRLNIGSAVSAIKKHDYEETRPQLFDCTNLWKKVLQKQKSALKSENKAKE